MNNHCADNFHIGCLKQVFKCKLHYHFNTLRKVKKTAFSITNYIDARHRKSTGYYVVNKWFTIHHYDEIVTK